MASNLATAWQVNNGLNLKLLDAIPAKAMKDKYSERTRTVAAQFAHMHNVRVYHLEKRARHQLGKLQSFERGAQPTKTQLRSALKASASAIGKMLEEFEAEGSVKSWNGPPATYLSYFIAHESHHRGLALVCMRVSGTRIPDEAKYGLWDGWRKGR
jgi:uncharacterized damage-inducible protein DinB